MEQGLLPKSCEWEIFQGARDGIEVEFKTHAFTKRLLMSMVSDFEGFTVVQVQCMEGKCGGREGFVDTMGHYGKMKKMQVSVPDR